MSGWVRVSKEEMARIRRIAAEKKAKRRAGAESTMPAAAHTRKPRRKRSPRAMLVEKLDKIFSLFIRLRGKKRTKGLCEVCLKRPIDHCFHWVGRGDFATRWDPDNAVASCRGCNFDEHHRKRPYRDLHIQRIGLAAREALEAKARAMAKWTDAELMEMISSLSQRIQEVV